jgi:hypothetical protein
MLPSGCLRRSSTSDLIFRKGVERNSPKKPKYAEKRVHFFGKNAQRLVLWFVGNKRCETQILTDSETQVNEVQAAPARKFRTA